MSTAYVIIPSGYAHIVHRFVGGGLPQGAAVTYGVALQGAMFLQTRAEALHDAFTARILPRLANTITLQETLLKAGPNATGPSVLWTDANLGGSASTQAPPNVAYLVRKVTAGGGRRSRGRIFLPGALEGAIGPDGTVTVAEVNGWQTALNSWLTDLDAINSPMVLLHSQSSDPTDVTELQFDNRAATQRRRLR